MTRINVVPVKELCDQHLMAEFREITRIPSYLKKSLHRKSKPFTHSEIPAEYTLGTGHVKFFYDKLQYLQWRYFYIYRELQKRKFNIIYRANVFNIGLYGYFNNYAPTQKALTINRERIAERMPKNPRWT